MPPKVLLFFRAGLVLVATGLLVFLLWRGDLSPQLRVILIAALAFYVVRLWLTVSRTRGRSTQPRDNDTTAE